LRVVLLVDLAEEIKAVAEQADLELQLLLYLTTKQPILKKQLPQQLLELLLVQVVLQ
jgi:hypothetical protein